MRNRQLQLQSSPVGERSPSLSSRRPRSAASLAHITTFTFFPSDHSFFSIQFLPIFDPPSLSLYIDIDIYWHLSLSLALFLSLSVVISAGERNLVGVSSSWDSFEVRVF